MKIVVDTEKLISSSNKMTELADAHKANAAQIFQVVAEMGSAWQGKDNEAFVAQINGFKDDFIELENVLRQYSSMLLNADKEYRQVLTDSYLLASAI